MNFIHTSHRAGNGGWDYDGVETTSDTESTDGKIIVNCTATHLTSFAVLVDVSGVLNVSIYDHVRRRTCTMTKEKT